MKAKYTIEHNIRKCDSLTISITIVRYRLNLKCAVVNYYRLLNRPHFILYEVKQRALIMFVANYYIILLLLLFLYNYLPKAR